MARQALCSCSRQRNLRRHTPIPPLHTRAPAAGSPYNGLAYCERFPRGPAGAAPAPQYWAQVGAAVVARSNFDDIGSSLLTIFQILTLENWNSIMVRG